ncbi:hypothetical protein BC832DRAFT_595061 [Gaertneriomyces semiglobifer]|nr:hypothetical protein BC832DRAFT_595061 [Gaertneriomyces semiglobifer]
MGLGKLFSSSKTPREVRESAPRQAVEKPDSRPSPTQITLPDVATSADHSSSRGNRRRNDGSAGTGLGSGSGLGSGGLFEDIMSSLDKLQLDDDEHAAQSNERQFRRGIASRSSKEPAKPPLPKTNVSSSSVDKPPNAYTARVHRIGSSDRIGPTEVRKALKRQTQPERDRPQTSMNDAEDDYWAKWKGLDGVSTKSSMQSDRYSAREPAKSNGGANRVYNRAAKRNPHQPARRPSIALSSSSTEEQSDGSDSSDDEDTPVALARASVPGGAAAARMAGGDGAPRGRAARRLAIENAIKRAGNAAAAPHDPSVESWVSRQPVTGEPRTITSFTDRRASSVGPPLESQKRQPPFGYITPSSSTASSANSGTRHVQAPVWRGLADRKRHMSAEALTERAARQTVEGMTPPGMTAGGVYPAPEYFATYGIPMPQLSALSSFAPSAKSTSGSDKTAPEPLIRGFQDFSNQPSDAGSAKTPDSPHTATSDTVTAPAEPYPSALPVDQITPPATPGRTPDASGMGPQQAQQWQQQQQQYAAYVQYYYYQQYMMQMQQIAMAQGGALPGNSKSSKKKKSKKTKSRKSMVENTGLNPEATSDAVADAVDTSVTTQADVTQPAPTE